MLDVLGRQEAGDRHGMQLVARIPIGGDHGVADRDDLERGTVVDHHRLRILFEQEPVALLAGTQLLASDAQGGPEGQPHADEHQGQRGQADRERADVIPGAGDQDAPGSLTVTSAGKTSPDTVDKVKSRSGRRLPPTSTSRSRRAPSAMRCVDDRAEALVSDEVERVAGGHDGHAHGDQRQRCPTATAHDHGGASDDAENEQVADRICQIGDVAQRSARDRCQGGKANAGERGHAGAAIAPSSQFGMARPDLLARVQHHGDQGDGEKAKVEGVGHRRRRGVRPSQRLDGQKQVADRPREAGGPHDERHPPVRPAPPGCRRRSALATASKITTAPNHRATARTTPRCGTRSRRDSRRAGCPSARERSGARLARAGEPPASGSACDTRKTPERRATMAWISTHRRPGGPGATAARRPPRPVCRRTRTPVETTGCGRPTRGSQRDLRRVGVGHLGENEKRVPKLCPLTPSAAASAYARSSKSNPAAASASRAGARSSARAIR